jgi:hypothetical protein
MNPNRHQEDGASLTELFSSGVVMRMGSPQEDVIPAVFPDLSRYMSNGKKSCLGGPSTSSMQRAFLLLPLMMKGNSHVQHHYDD